MQGLLEQTLSHRNQALFSKASVYAPWQARRGGVQRPPLSQGRRAKSSATIRRMCRNIRVLHNFAPPTTPQEIRDASLQFVRKVSGSTKPTQADEAAFLKAVDEITESTERLLAALRPRGAVRTREGEREKAKAKWAKRENARELPATFKIIGGE